MFIGSYNKDKIIEIYNKNPESDIFRNSHSFSFYLPEGQYITHVVKKLGPPDFDTLSIPKGSYCILSSSYENTLNTIQPATKGSQLLWMLGYVDSFQKEKLTEKYTYPKTDWDTYLWLRKIQDEGYRHLPEGRYACLFVDEYKKLLTVFCNNNTQAYIDDEYTISSQYPSDKYNKKINSLRHDRIYEIDLLNKKIESIPKIQPTYSPVKVDLYD